MEIGIENQAGVGEQRDEDLKGNSTKAPVRNPIDLHLEFVRLGRERYKLMNRLLLILPDLYESGIYKKYAIDIYKYAGRFGGISRSAVDKRLRLEKHLQEKPQLKAAIEKVGVNKVALLATLATPKTEALFADKVLNMNKSAIQTLSKEIRQRETDRTNQANQEYWSPTDIQPCSAKPQTITIELDAEMTFLFLKLKKKYRNLNNQEVMRRILEKVDEPVLVPGRRTGQGGFAKRFEKVVAGDNSGQAGDNFKPEKRTVKIEKRRKILGNGKCQYPGCNKPSNHIHHPERYGKTKNHNSLIALCEDHHQFMHNGLIENEEAPQEYWALNLYKTPDEIDHLYRKYRRGTVRQGARV